MAKFGYTCKCGWKLNRGKKTRRQYAEAKEVHATPRNVGGEGCDLLREELAQGGKRANKETGRY